MGTRGRSKPLFVLGYQLLLPCAFILAVCMQWSGSLSTYEIASFDNPVEELTVTTRLDHFTVHPETGDVYVGAVNYLYRLNQNLVQVANVSTATCNEETCLNYNKVLALEGGRLITCGSEFEVSSSFFQCQSRRESDLMGDGDERNLIVAYGTRTTASIIAPGPGGMSDPRLYVAASYSTEQAYQDIPPITRRRLVTGRGFLFASEDDDVIRFTSAYIAQPFPIIYVSVFVWNGYTYFVTSQGQRPGQQNADISKIVRICHYSPDMRSYTEILISCTSEPGSSASNLVQAAHVGPAGPDLAASLGLAANEKVLYAAFASSLCVYKMSDIDAAFKQAVRGCVIVGSGLIGYLDGALCAGQFMPGFNTDQYVCKAQREYQYATGTEPVERTSIVHLPDHLPSSIITSIELNHTVAFIGTSEGQFLKVHIESGLFARLYENVALDGNSVMGDTMLSETTKELYVLTEQKLIKMRVENCSQYTTCETCIGTDAGNDGDPYCGWCTLERKCTRYNDCPMQDVYPRWLSYNDAQCIEITQVTPHNSLPITLTDQQITLTVQQLPELLSGEQYSCQFGDQFSTTAEKSGNNLECTTPPASNIPPITSGDHVTVVLSVRSSETSVNFVDIDFSFYECDTHKACVDCVGSRWACNWCVFDNKCTHDNSTCTVQNEIIITGNNSRGTAMEGPDACPQLQPQSGEVLIPNAISRVITVNVANLPTESRTTGFECSLDIEGTPQTATAARAGSSVTCNTKSYTYTATEQELDAVLTLSWEDSSNKMHRLDDRHGFTVTLYKCEVLRPDCSRCVSNETTRAELQCVWCGDTCVVSGSAVCSDVTAVTQDNNVNCPDPVLQQVYPLFGPIEGNTELTLTGTDLGRRFSDIKEVTVGGQNCPLNGMFYKTGNRVNCTTLPRTVTRRRRDVTPLSIQMVVEGRNGDLQQSQGDISFGYKDPVISDFIPKIGPQSGGTWLTISGESLDTGRNITVSIGGLLCDAEREEVRDDSISCETSSADSTGSWFIDVFFDGAVRNSSAQYTYATDPDVRNINPSTSVLAGGRELKVNGTGFSIIQDPQIVITAESSSLEFIGNCSVESDEVMICTSPKVDLPNLVLLDDSGLNVSTGFIMDDVTALRTWCSLDDRNDCTPLEYFQNPEYYPFNDASQYDFPDGIGMKDGDTMVIKGQRLDLAITSEEVTVYIGPERCGNITVGEGALSCILPENQPPAGDYLGSNTSKGLPVVWVIHGTTLRFNIGYFQYEGLPLTIIIACVVSASLLLLASLLAVVLYRKSKKAQQEVDKCLDDIDKVHKDLADDMRTAFAELQTDVTDLTSDLEGVGMPFVSHREYTSNMLFIALETKPMTTDPENPEEHVERAMKKFSDALNNKTFLLMLLQTLDAQSKSKLPVRERGAIASLLTVIMVAGNRLGYLTDVLFSLMAKLVQDELDANRPRQLFRRTETILEKLLSNWIALCLYDSLKDHTAYPLFVLYRAIKCHTEHGPMDIISGQAKYTLSDDRLLTEDIEFREMVLTVIVNDADGETKEVKVLDVDTISQVKEKILDAIHRNQPYSNRPTANQVELEWRHGKAGHQVLKDVDVTNVTLDGWKRINTLRFFHVPNKSTMALVPASPEGIKKSTSASADSVYVNFGFAGSDSSQGPGVKRSNRYTMVEVETEENSRLWHLTKREDGDFNNTRTRRKKRLSKRLSTMGVHPMKRFRELYIPRLIGTKGTIQEYIDHMFEAILNPSTAPSAVKYLFDFFDSQAVRHLITDSEAVRMWKGNSLSLRFWSNAIRRPDFVFDIRPSRAVEASLGIIAQAFYDAHSASDQKLGKDSDLSKLLFNKDLPRIESLVDNYYDGILNRPRVTLQELNKELAKTCQNFTGLFSVLSTLLQLWEHIKKFNPKIVEACEEDEACQQEQLAYKLVEVETILSDRDCDDEEPV